jgi:putative transposase
MRFASPAMSPKPDMEAASGVEWEIASRRAHAMEDLLVNGVGPVRVAAVARENGLSVAMVYRLLARYRANPVPSSLLPGNSGPPTGSRRLDEEVEAIIQREIEAYYLKRESPRVVDLHTQIALECRRQHLTRPSYKAVWTRVRQIDPATLTRAREGFQAARDRFGSL